jgi:hypothetical protein
MQDGVTVREIRTAKQWMSPNTRGEVDYCLRRNLPLHPPLLQLVRDLLKKHTPRSNNARK